MKKLLFLINTLNGGGAERVLTELANGLSADGYDVTVQTVSDCGVFRDRLKDTVHYKSIVKTRIKQLHHILVYAVSFILPPGLVHRMSIGNRYDYEIAFLEGVPTKLIAASPNKKSKKYTWVHIDLYNTFGLDKVHKNMQKHVGSYEKFDKIVCVSETVKEAFTKRFGIKDKLIVKYNFLDDDNIREKAAEKVEKSGHFRIVSVGRLEYQKGYDRLLSIMKQLKADNIDCELVLVGEGKRRAELERYVNFNSLTDRVTFIGFCDNPYKYMQSADLLVFPSRAEGYSTVATEALILGKPIVVSDCSGMRELFGDSEYGLVTENNERSLYDGIKKMICDDELRSCYAEKALCRSRDFSKSARLKEIEKLFIE